MEIYDTNCGYGYVFKNSHTTYDEEYNGSESYQRLVVYDLAGLQCIVRSEPDGYLPNKLPPTTRSSINSQERDVKMSGAAGDAKPVSGVNQLPTNTVHITTSNSTTPNQSLTEVPKGVVIPEAALFDLKTQSTTTLNPLTQSKIFARAWTRQIPNFVLARHTRGVFEDIDIETHDLTRHVQIWEEENHLAIRKLVTLLRVLRKAAGKQENNRIELRRTDTSDAIQIWTAREDETDGGISVLPDELKVRWLGKSTPGSV